jgi:hypothetical protein
MTLQHADPSIEPFTVRIPQADLDDLRQRLASTRWAPREPGEPVKPGQAAASHDGAYGFPLSRLRRLVSRWQEFDWRRQEDRLNAYPQFRTVIDGQPVHFLHVRSAVPDALPVVLSHGWPGSVFEYLELIGRLTDPVARLGYARYGAIGNDAGSMISPELGRLQPGRVAGVHVTQLFSFPGGDPGELAGLDRADQEAMSVLTWFWQHKGAFNVLHGQQPQTVAHALADSPAGLLAWNAQLFDETLDDEFVLANVTLYWLTGTAGTSIRHYYEDTHAPAGSPPGPTTVPIGLAAATKGDFRSIRRFAQRDHTRITSWTELPGVVGHYSAHTSPDQLAADIRRFFRPLRPASATPASATRGAATKGK